MHLINRRGLAALTAGVGVITAAAGISSGVHSGNRSAFRVVQSSPVAAIATTDPASPASTAASAPETAATGARAAAPRPATAMRGPIGLGAAESVAVRAGGGRVVKARLDEEAEGAQYDLTVLRADGSEVDLTLDARTGRILEQQLDGQDTAEQPDGHDTADHPDASEAPDQAD